MRAEVTVRRDFSFGFLPMKLRTCETKESEPRQQFSIPDVRYITHADSRCYSDVFRTELNGAFPCVFVQHYTRRVLVVALADAELRGGGGTEINTKPRQRTGAMIEGDADPHEQSKRVSERQTERLSQGAC